MTGVSPKKESPHEVSNVTIEEQLHASNIMWDSIDEQPATPGFIRGRQGSHSSLLKVE